MRFTTSISWVISRMVSPRRLGLTILLITHEMDVVKRICDCVAVISNGQLIEQDTVSEVFSHPKTPLAQQFIPPPRSRRCVSPHPFRG